MSKIGDARDILEQLGLPPAQRNEISCLTLLALTGLSEDDSWKQASNPSRTIHQILGFMRDTYERDYAENTREVVRRQVIHQFEQARVVDRNPDEPDLPTNSPRTHYGLTDEGAELCCGSTRSPAGSPRLNAFRRIGPVMACCTGDRTSGGGGCRRFLYAQLELERRSRRSPRQAQQTAGSGGDRLFHGSVRVRTRDQTLLYLGDAANKLYHLDRDMLDCSLAVSPYGARQATRRGSLRRGAGMVISG